LYVSNFCVFLDVNYRGKRSFLQNLGVGLQLSHVLANIFSRVIEITQRRAFLVFSTWWLLEIFEIKISLKIIKNDQKRREKTIFWL